ncbi:hypothetical protein CHUAL_012678 [Chamberlinius hualienensis]
MLQNLGLVWIETNDNMDEGKEIEGTSQSIHQPFCLDIDYEGQSQIQSSLLINRLGKQLKSHLFQLSIESEKLFSELQANVERNIFELWKNPLKDEFNYFNPFMVNHYQLQNYNGLPNSLRTDTTTTNIRPCTVMHEIKRQMIISASENEESNINENCTSEWEKSLDSGPSILNMVKSSLKDVQFNNTENYFPGGDMTVNIEERMNESKDFISDCTLSDIELSFLNKNKRKYEDWVIRRTSNVPSK